MVGLDSALPRSRQPPPHGSDEARILELTRREPTDGSTHWSSYRLAKEVGVKSVDGQSSVAAIWTATPPFRAATWSVMIRKFEEKRLTSIGLYLKPTVHAAVFCVDEKSAIQALDRLDPVLPLSPGRAERQWL